MGIIGSKLSFLDKKFHWLALGNDQPPYPNNLQVMPERISKSCGRIGLPAKAARYFVLYKYTRNFRALINVGNMPWVIS
jgi:hypothetical protein